MGAPEFLLDGPQYQAPVDGLRVSADLAENYDRWTEDLGESEFMGSVSHRWALREAAGVVGAITPWNFPIRSTWPRSVRPLPRMLGGAQPAPDTPWCATALARLARGTPISRPVY
ncbi:MAG: aldehyde dehydrogenase family protein [Microthrixaceae bacterium]